METVYNLAIIGYGGMGSYHAKHIIPAHSNIKVIGTFDVLDERQQVAIQDGFHAYESLECLLNDSNVQIVLIATPNDIHKELAIQALRAHKHVVCEKPVTITCGELKEIMEVEKETGYVFMVHQNRRWDEDFLIAKEIYDHKLIGDVFTFESRVQGANGIPGDWRHLKCHGGGMLLDWGVHLLDQLLLMVSSKIMSVFTTMSTVLGDDVDDGFQAVITFENGIKALIEVGTTNFIQLPRWYLCGTDGSAVIENWNLDGQLVIRNDMVNVQAPTPIKAGQGLTKTMAPPSEEATTKKDLPAPQAMSQSFYENLLAVIEGQSAPIVKNEEVLRVMNLIEVIFKAATLNEVVKDFDTYI